MTPNQKPRLSREELLTAARRLLPDIAAQADSTESERRVSPVIVSELQKSGLLTLLLPASLGGAEADFSTFSQITRLLATACASTAWTFAVLAECAWIATLFPQKAREEVWGGDLNPLFCGAIIPVGLATKVDGGFRISGKWSYLSGSNHANWVFLSMPTDHPLRAGNLIDVLVRRSEIEIVDDWHVMGMVGTATNSAVAKDVFVPDHRCILHSDLLAGTTLIHDKDPLNYPLGRVPRGLVVSFSLSPVIVGLASRALQLTGEAMAKRRNATLPPEWTSLQIKFAEAAINVEMANTILTTYGERNDAITNSGAPVSEFDIGKNKLGAAQMVRSSKRAIDLLVEISGSKWLYDTHPLQRIFRDATAVASHRSCNWDVLALAYTTAALPVYDQVVGPPR